MSVAIAGRLALVIGVVVASPSRAEAWNPIKAAADKLKAAGRAIGASAGRFVESATAPAIRNGEDAGHRLIADVDVAIASNLDRAGSFTAALVTQVDGALGARLEQVDRSLQARILQVQTGIDHSIDHTFDRLDLMLGRLDQDAQQLIVRAERVGKDLIKQLDQTTATTLAKADQILGARLTDLRLLVTSALQQADDVARARLEQLDELAGRRLGNLDVIATKQSLSLEGMLIRIAALVGLVGLIVFVAWRVFREVGDALVTSGAGLRRFARVKAVGWRGGRRLVPQLALAGAGALVLYGLSSFLPRDSVRRADLQAARHEAAFAAAVHALDVIDARYHESQLEILAPDKIAGTRARMKKAELLHSLFTRPGQLNTQAGLSSLVAQVAEVELAVGADDPDLMIAKAYVLWQVGGTRDDEYEAVTLCAAALRHGDGLLLAPLARNYIVAFLGDPYVPAAGATGPTLAALAALAATPPGKAETTQFDHVIQFDRLVAQLDRASTAAYLDMLAAQAELRVALAAHPKGPDSPAARGARNARTLAAGKLIDAWAYFDRELESSPSFASDAIVLSVFTLDDAVLSRARYYVAVPTANELAPMLTEQPSPRSLTPALRARIAPLRVAWEQRYAPLLGPRERDLVAYEEARRFEAFEQRAATFEAAYVDFLVAVRTTAAPARLVEVAAAAAVHAAGMGLYRDAEGGRVSEASHILASLHDHGQQPSSELLATIERNYRVRRLRFL